MGKKEVNKSTTIDGLRAHSNYPQFSQYAHTGMPAMGFVNVPRHFTAGARHTVGAKANTSQCWASVPKHLPLERWVVSITDNQRQGFWGRGKIEGLELGRGRAEHCVDWA